MKFGKMRFLLIALMATFAVLGVLLVPKYNGYDLPVLPESEYQNAYIAVSGDTAYLYFVDKKGYIEVDPDGFGNIYTLGLTTTDPYDESKILYVEKYTATIGGDSWTAEELPDFSGVYDIPAYAQFSLPCEIGGPVWSNVTLLDQDGNVFIEGSKPIDADKAARRRYSFTLGYLLAQCTPPLKLPDTQPTAYSYNGVVLPGLPEWDREMYPYALLFPNGMGEIVSSAPNYYLYLFVTPNFGINEDTGTWCFFADARIPHYKNSGWGEFSTESGKGIYDAVDWANFDIPTEDGTIFLAASDPIPVYE